MATIVKYVSQTGAGNGSGSTRENTVSYENSLRDQTINNDDINYRMLKNLNYLASRFFAGKKEFDTSIGRFIFEPDDITQPCTITGDVLDLTTGNILDVNKSSHNAVFKDLTITGYLQARDLKTLYPEYIEYGTNDSGVQEGQNYRPKNAINLSSNASMINCIQHDNTVGITSYGDGYGNDIYGNITFNTGYMSYLKWVRDGLFRYEERGPNMYIQHENPLPGVIKRLRMGASFNSFRMGLQVFSTSKTIKQVHVIDYSFFHAGQISPTKKAPHQVILGSYANDDDDIQFVNSVSYNDKDFGNIIAGYKGTNLDGKVQGSTIWGGSSLLTINKHLTYTIADSIFVCNEHTGNTININIPGADQDFSKYTVNNNKYYANGYNTKFQITWQGETGVTTPAPLYNLTFEELKAKTGWDTNSTYSPGPPPNKVLVKKNIFREKMAKIDLLNYSRQIWMQVDLSTILNIGDTYEIRDVQNLLNDYILKTTYDGNLVTLPTTMTEVTQPSGAGLAESLHTDREYNCLIVVPQNYKGWPHHNGTSAPVYTVEGTPLKSPSNLTVTIVDETTLTINFTDNSIDELGFEIERSTNNINFALVQTQVGTNWTNTGLTPNATYYYRARAYKTGNFSGYSNTEKATITVLKTLYRATFPNSTGVDQRIEAGGYGWKILIGSSGSSVVGDNNQYGISKLAGIGNNQPVNSAKSEVSNNGFLYSERAAELIMIGTDELQIDRTDHYIEDFRWYGNWAVDVDASLAVRIGTQWYNCADRHKSSGLTSRTDFLNSGQLYIQKFKFDQPIWRPFTANPTGTVTQPGSDSGKMDSPSPVILPTTGLITKFDLYFHGNTHVRLDSFEIKERDFTATEDTTPPEIILTGSNITLTEGDAYVEPGYSATDNIDGVITANVIVSYGTLNTTSANVGTHTVSYNVSDSATTPNVATTKTRTVTVNAAPVPDAYVATIFQVFLKDAETLSIIKEIESGDIIEVDPAKRVYVDAVTSPYPVGSLRYNLNNGAYLWNEAGKPYTLYSKTGTNYWEGSTISRYLTLNLTITPYELSGQTGQVGTPRDISFTIVEPPVDNEAPTIVEEILAGVNRFFRMFVGFFR